MNGSTPHAAREIVLGIELSNPSASPDAHAVALFACDALSPDKRTGRLVGSLPVSSTMRSSEGLMVLIERLCAEYEIVPGKIAQLIVSIGPGGYTALRISTTTAKVLAHTLGCALIGVPTALVAARAVGLDRRPGLIALASKNQRAHCSVVWADGSVEAVGVIGADQARALVDAHGVRSLVGDGHLPSSFVDMAQQGGIAIDPIRLDARDVLEASAGIGPSTLIELAPIYAREPDAVTQWRTRRSG